MKEIIDAENNDYEPPDFTHNEVNNKKEGLKSEQNQIAHKKNLEDKLKEIKTSEIVEDKAYLSIIEESKVEIQSKSSLDRKSQTKKRQELCKEIKFAKNFSTIKQVQCPICTKLVEERKIKYHANKCLFLQSQEELYLKAIERKRMHNSEDYKDNRNKKQKNYDEEMIEYEEDRRREYRKPQRKSQYNHRSSY